MLNSKEQTIPTRKKKYGYSETFFSGSPFLSE